MDIKDIQNLIKFVAKSGASEVKLEMEDVKITIKTGAENDRVETVYQAPPTVVHAAPAAAPTPAAPAPAAPAEPAAEAPAQMESDKYITVKSPIIGTFYRKPSPETSLSISLNNFMASITHITLPGLTESPTSKKTG